MDFSPIVGGVAAGVGANESQKFIDRHLRGKPEQESLLQALHTAVSELRTELKIITQCIADTKLPPVDELVQIQPAPWSFRLHRKERRYSHILLPNNTTQLIFNIPGLGTVNYTPPIGWSELNFPSGTEVSLASGTSASLMYRCTNIPLGANVL